MTAIWTAVDALTQPRHIRLTRDNGTTDWAQTPSLWHQLEAAISTGSRRGGRNTSRTWTPLDIDSMELAATIRDTIVDALTGHDQPPVTDGPPAEQIRAIKAQRDAERSYGLYVTHLTPLPPRPTVLVPDSLRRLASTVTATLDYDLIAWWTYRIHSWTTQITHTLRLEEAPQPRRIRDTACPMCHATHVTIPGPDGPERAPALLIDFTDGYIRAATCSSCGLAWFRGHELHHLADLLAQRGDLTDSESQAV